MGDFGTKLTPEEEAKFQRDMRGGDGYRQWYEEFNRLNGGYPNLDDPDYDYRLAWKNGVKPAPYKHDGRYHWGSSLPDGQMLKSENHPTAWMEHFMRATGQDPNDIGIEDEAAGKRYMDNKWEVSIGDAEIKEPWKVELGPIQDYREIPDPYEFEMGPIQDYREYDGSDVEIGPAEVDPLVFGQAEIMDPWQVDFGPAQDVVEMGPAEVTGSGDFEVGNPDQEGPPYSVMVKKGRTSAYGR